MAKVVVNVEDGMVRAAFSTDLNVDLEVIDLDVSSYPDEVEMDAAESGRKRLEEIQDSPDWHQVW